MKYTLSIIKPEILKKEGEKERFNDAIKKAGFSILKHKTMLLSEKQAEDFYDIHRARPFFGELVSYMTSGEVVVQALYYDGDAVSEFRELMGSTNPQEAVSGTLRAMFGKSISENAVHGSDSNANAERETRFFFTAEEVNSIRSSSV